MSISVPTTHNNVIIDLRSDTVTLPTAAMRQRMSSCPVGDDVFGEDPTINELETRVAKMFGKESSLFFPSGTMSNLAAVMSWCGTRGSEMILGDSSHIHLFEQAGTAQLAGVGSRVIPNKRDGTMYIDAVEAAIRGENIHFPVTELIAIENTHNYCGGRVLPKGYTEELYWMAHKNGVPVHLDGARIWNAAAAMQQPVANLVQYVDSVSACLSKGLGAPAGSLLIGPTSLIKKAKRARKALGGGMRQAGILAAAGLQALDDFERGMLNNDHVRAVAIAEKLAMLPGLTVDVDVVDTNIVLVHLDNSNTCEPSAFAGMLRERGVLVLPFGSSTLRLVTHRDITDRDVELTVSIFRDVAARVWAISPHYVLDGAVESASSTLDLIHQKSVIFLDTTVEESVDHTKQLSSGDPQPQQIVIEKEFSENSDSSQFYEEVTLYGMSVSEMGFCVLLKGVICDRLLKILVTPADPMSDGLDREQVETSEAVTLLQLLQGIDVESYLAKDALSMKFSSAASPPPSALSPSSSNSNLDGSPTSTANSPSSANTPNTAHSSSTPALALSSSSSSTSSSSSSNVGGVVQSSASLDGSSSSVSGGKPKKYELKRVMIDNVSDDQKTFQARLIGIRKRSKRSSSSTPTVTTTEGISSSTSPPSELNSSEAEISIAASFGYSSSHEKTVLSNELFGRSSGQSDSIFPLERESTEEMRLYVAQSNEVSSAVPVDWTATPPAASSGMSSSEKEREVELKSAFEAIALAIRHRSVIEVRSDLLQDENNSYAVEELPSFFPNLLVSEQTVPSAYLISSDTGSIDNNITSVNQVFDIERLQRQFKEAVRQKNEAKIDSIKRRLDAAIASATSDAKLKGRATSSLNNNPASHLPQHTTH